ncbi:unnamed protein product [Durusdinium trenchii]|uniref:Uncharacterized protein n=1 Tax=Durusdinium trenchii TaxID=1381693 RepID=A0ABP0QHL7_9DINO
MKNLGSVYTSWALKLARSCPAVRALPASDRWHGHHLIDGTPKDRCLAPSWLPTMSWIYFLEVYESMYASMLTDLLQSLRCCWLFFRNRTSKPTTFITLGQAQMVQLAPAIFVQVDLCPGRQRCHGL